MAKFIDAYNKSVKAEGGFQLTNNAGDTGGYTYAGISRKWHPKWAGWALVDSLVAQKKLIVNSGKAYITPELEKLVQSFYKAEFWDLAKCDSIESQKVAEFIFDFGINAGMDDSIPLAQKVSGAVPDGKAGAKTVLAINACTEATFMQEFYNGVVAFYKAIVARDASQKKWLNGWLNRAKHHLI